LTEHLPLISSDTRFPFYRKQGLDLIFNKKWFFSLANFSLLKDS
jgi:hypothetical protein